MKKKRATNHYARTTEGGKAFSPKHDDRKYSKDLTPDNIIPEKSKDNVYRICWVENEPKDTITSFEDHEKWVYKNFLGQFFEEQNERNKKARHLERVKTIDQFRKMARYCPEEVLWYVGKKDNSATAEHLEKMAQEQIEWEEKNYPGLKYLDWAVHVDELGAPHVQARRIWTYDKNGVVAVGQNKALEQMGVELPNPEESISELNNRKITYTADARAHWIELAEKLGYEIEKKPKEKNGLTLSEWQFEQDCEKRSKAISDVEKNLEDRQKTLSDAENDLSERLESKNREITRANGQISEFETIQKQLQFTQNFENRAENAVLEMVSRGSYTEKSDSKQLFGALKVAVKGFMKLKQKVKDVLFAPLDKVEEWCRKARLSGCKNLDEYLFPAPTQEIKKIKKIEKDEDKSYHRGR